MRLSDSLVHSHTLTTRNTLETFGGLMPARLIPTCRQINFHQVKLSSGDLTSIQHEINVRVNLRIIELIW